MNKYENKYENKYVNITIQELFERKSVRVFEEKEISSREKSHDRNRSHYISSLVYRNKTGNG